MGKTKILLAVILAIVAILAISPAMSAITYSPEHTGAVNGALPDASTTSLGKAVFTGEFTNNTGVSAFYFNVSWATFTDQSIGKVCYSQSQTITKNTANVSFATLNFTYITVNLIGNWYFLIQNGTAFPSSLVTEFSNSVKVSYVLEPFKVSNIGNKFVNVSWNKFNHQQFVSVLFVKGNASKMSAKAQSIQVNANFIDIKLSNYTEYSFLVVNSSLYPAGSVNVSSYVQSITLSPPAQISGFLIGVNDNVVLISFGTLAIIAIAVTLGYLIVRKEEHHGKHKKE